MLSLTWQVYILFRAIAVKNLEDIWINITCSMWLFGHFWWMAGELHDTKYPNEPPIYDMRTVQTGYIFITASVLIGVYYVIIKPTLLLIAFYSKTKTATDSTEPGNDRSSQDAKTCSTSAKTTSERLILQEGSSSSSSKNWRFSFFFHSWREYENIHCLFWILKDTGWNW
jgi:hypothetical protein